MKIKIPFTSKYLSITKNHGMNVSFAVGGTWMPQNQRAYVDSGYKLNPHLYSVISRISRIAALTKWQQFDTTGEEDEQVKDSPELDLINNPNSHQSRREWIECAIAYKLLLGERFILKGSPENGVNAGRVTELHHLPPPVMGVKFTKLGEPVLFKWGINETPIDIPPEKIIYSKYWNPTSGARPDHRGMSPLESGRRVVTQSNDVFVAGATLLQNLGSPGMMTLDPGEDVDMDQTQLDQAQSQFQHKFAGAGNIMKMWFTNMKWNYTKISQNAKEMGLSESHKQTLRDICNIYGTYSQIFNDPDNKAHNNVREARKDLISNVVLPEVESLAGELSRDLLPKGMEFRPDLSVWPELKEDMSALVTALNTAWWMSPNEKRATMGQESHEDEAMDDIFIPTSVMPLGADAAMELEKMLKNGSEKG